MYHSRVLFIRGRPSPPLSPLGPSRIHLPPRLSRRPLPARFSSTLSHFPFFASFLGNSMARSRDIFLVRCGLPSRRPPMLELRRSHRNQITKRASSPKRTFPEFWVSPSSLVPRPHPWPSEQPVGKAGIAAGQRLWMNLLICSLSFIELGSSGVAPCGARAGDELAPHQRECVARLERLLIPWLGVRTALAPQYLGPYV